MNLSKFCSKRAVLIIIVRIWMFLGSAVTILLIAYIGGFNKDIVNTIFC